MPWSDPTLDVATRWRSERLKGGMETRMLSDVWSAAKSKDPEVRRFREVFGGEIRKVRNLKE